MTTIQSNNPKLDTFFKKIQNDHVDHDSTEKAPAAWLWVISTISSNPKKWRLKREILLSVPVLRWRCSVITHPRSFCFEGVGASQSFAATFPAQHGEHRFPKLLQSLTITSYHRLYDIQSICVDRNTFFWHVEIPSLPCSNPKIDRNL